MTTVTEDLRNAIGIIGTTDPDDSMAQAGMLLALSSIARHLDRMYNRLAHIEDRLEELK